MIAREQHGAYVVLRVEDGDGPAAENLQLIVRKMVDKAREGDVASIREVFDRTDGKALPAAAIGTASPILAAPLGNTDGRHSAAAVRRRPRSH